MENRATNRRCSRDPASPVLRARAKTRRPTIKARPDISARLASRTNSTAWLVDPRAVPDVAPGAAATSQTAAAVMTTAMK